MHKGFWAKYNQPFIGLSPMDGVTDAPFRYLTAKHGKPNLIMTEFTSVEGLKYGAVKALANLIYSDIERSICAQIYGKDLDGFYQATIISAELGFDGIDINMGCPSKGVSGNGAGAALIATPKHAQKIVRTCQKAIKDWSEGQNMDKAGCHPDIIAAVNQMKTENPHYDIDRQLLPISVKTRTGFDKIITEDWIKTLLETQPANLSLHGRTLKQMYSGEANWEEIAKAAKLCKQAKITCLGNGDVQSLKDAHQKIKDYGVDGVLIGRATFGNPWIFQGLTPTTEQRLQLALEHTQLYTKIFQTDYIEPLKKHLGWYCKEFNGAKELRLRLMTSKTPNEIQAIL